MSSLPSGIGAVGPGAYVPQANLKLPTSGYNIPVAQQTPQITTTTPVSGASVGGKATRNPYAPFAVSAPMLQTYGIGSAFNPMTVFDLMNMGAGPFVSPFAGSGLQGYSGLPSGASMGSPAGSAISGAMIQSPLPQSGGKSVMG